MGKKRLMTVKGEGYRDRFAFFLKVHLPHAAAVEVKKIMIQASFQCSTQWALI